MRSQYRCDDVIVDQTDLVVSGLAHDERCSSCAILCVRRQRGDAGLTESLPGIAVRRTGHCAHTVARRDDDAEPVFCVDECVGYGCAARASLPGTHVRMARATAVGHMARPAGLCRAPHAGNAREGHMCRFVELVYRYDFPKPHSPTGHVVTYPNLIALP
eukprot:7335401-Prymnesium_polylepis.2